MADKESNQESLKTLLDSDDGFKKIFKNCGNCQNFWDMMTEKNPDLESDLREMSEDELEDFLGYKVCYKCNECGPCNIFCFCEDEDGEDDAEEN